ncbi:MAG TPA: beta-ketoacyl-[acyl-carrier-protein] synthase family protein [Alphaproteobacteria bacterium]|nr:beta-ketoacyl-[acyl-carrier-protein] synthase family protein [Alphaproteobacteria bacterium]
MRRVVVTGMGIVSSIGNSKGEVLRSLREGHSGLEFIPEMRELGLQCQVAGRVKGLETALEKLGKRSLQTMSSVAKYTAVATLEAIADAQLPNDALRSRHAGVVVGTAFGGINEVPKTELMLFAHKSPTRLGATGAVKIMNSTVAVNLAVWLGIKGRCYAVSSACATGTDNIGHGFELIRHGLLDVCICGGAEENWIGAAAYLDNAFLGGTEFNARPGEVCRPYDRDRCGFVMSEGAGILILEAFEHAMARGAPVYAEVIGYGSANDGDNMFEPKGGGLERSLRQALQMADDYGLGSIDYINPHGAGTPVGDPVEVQVIREVFGQSSPWVSSTKSLSGHSQGAAGAHEAIFTLLMLQHGFVVPTLNLEHVAPECDGIRHVRTLLEMPLQTGMSFNAGLGGANACLIFRKLS